MEIAKYTFFIVASITLFGIFGGFAPDITLPEVTLKAVFVGLIFSGVTILNEVKTALFQRIS